MSGAILLSVFLKKVNLVQIGTYLLSLYLTHTVSQQGFWGRQLLFEANKPFLDLSEYVLNMTQCISVLNKDYFVSMWLLCSLFPVYPVIFLKALGFFKYLFDCLIKFHCFIKAFISLHIWIVNFFFWRMAGSLTETSRAPLFLPSVSGDILPLPYCHTNKSSQITCRGTVLKYTMHFKGNLLFSFQSDEQCEETPATAQCYSL